MTVTAKKTTKKKAAKKTTKKKAAKSNPNKVEEVYDLLSQYEMQTLVNDDTPEDVQFIKFKNYVLNMILGGGIMSGVAVEISGVSQAGKSYLAYELLASVLNAGGHGYLNDNECAYSKSYGKRVGIKNGAIYKYDREKDIDTFFRKARAFIKGIRKIDLHGLIIIISDSYGGLSTNVDMDNEEAEKDPRGYMYMIKANVFGTNMRTFTKYLEENNACMVVLTQCSPDTEKSTKYYKAYKSPAEETLGFYYTQRLRLTNVTRVRKEIKLPNSDKKKRVTTGQLVKVEAVKNRVAPPHREAVIEISYLKGIRPTSGLEDYLILEGVITKGTFMHNGSKVKGFKHIESGDKFVTFKELVTKYPDVIEPKNNFNTDIDVEWDDEETLL